MPLAIGERVGLTRRAVIGAGFIGALISSAPGFVEVGLETLALIYVAVCYGGSNALTRRSP